MSIRCHFGRKIVYTMPVRVEANLSGSNVLLARVYIDRVSAIDGNLNEVTDIDSNDFLTDAGRLALEDEKRSLLIAIKFHDSESLGPIWPEARLQQYLYEKEPSEIVPLAFKTCTCFYLKKPNGCAYPAKLSVFQPSIGRGGRTVEAFDAERALSQTEDEEDGDEADEDGAKKIYSATVETITRISQHMKDSGLAVDCNDIDWFEHRNRINNLYHDFDQNVYAPATTRKRKAEAVE
jgi:hypothetical protein